LNLWAPYFICASNEEEFKEWLTALFQVVSKFTTPEENFENNLEKFLQQAYVESLVVIFTRFFSESLLFSVFYQFCSVQSNPKPTEKRKVKQSSRVKDVTSSVSSSVPVSSYLRGNNKENSSTTLSPDGSTKISSSLVPQNVVLASEKTMEKMINDTDHTIDKNVNTNVSNIRKLDTDVDPSSIASENNLLSVKSATQNAKLTLVRTLNVKKFIVAYFTFWRQFF
jgi:hypothetical protein